MKYFKKTLEYLFKLEHGKRFAFLFLLSLPIGFGAAVCAPHYVYKNWLQEFSVGNLNYLSALTFGGSADPLRMVIAGAVTTLVLIFFIAVISSVISRSLRVGVFSVNRLSHEFNEAVIPSFFAVLTSVALVVVAKLLQGAFLVLFQTFHNTLLSAILSALAVFFNVALVCYCLGFGILYLPYMTFNGLRPFVALAEATNRIGTRYALRMFLCVFLPVLATFVVGGLVSLANSFVASLIVEAILYTLLIVYLVTLTFISYYEINDLPREDYPREFFYTKMKRR